MSFLDPTPWVNLVAGSPQEKAARQQAQQASDYNALLERTFHEARGSTGHAILPEYFGQTEQQAGDYAGALSAAARAAFGSPTDVANLGKSIAAKYQPILDAGGASISGIYNGAEEAKRLAAAKPVFDARVAGAKGQKQGIMQALSDRLQAISAGNAAKGYVGAGSTAGNAALRTSIGANQAASAALSGANLANVSDVAGIKNRILDLQLQSPQLASALANEAVKLGLLPAEFVGGVSAATTSPFNFFKIGTGQPSRPELAPWAQPQARFVDMLAGGAGQDINTAARYLLNRNLADQYGGGGGSTYMPYDFPGTGNSPDWNPGQSYTPPVPGYSDYGG